jgi:transposase
MHLKSKIEDTKKDKNVLSVALKGSKQQIKENQKAFTKEKDEMEQRIRDLCEFKTKKLNED